MELMAFGGKVEAIGCDFVVGGDVFELDDEGNQVQGRAGKAIEVKQGVISGAPEACPLTLEQSKRELASFVVCQTCPNSTVVSPGVIEC